MQPNQQQAEAWNGPESAHYVDHADRYDRQLVPITDALLARAAISSTDVVLDVACGSGAGALIAARAAHSVTGVDISEPLVRLARERARQSSIDNAEFVVADAQTHDLDGRRFDVLISQFGLMFFDDPVGAFTNLRHTLNPDGRIAFSTWQGLAAQDWLAPVTAAVGRHADVPDLGGLANGGGMFALKDETEMAELLDAAGYRDVMVESTRPLLTIGGGGSLQEAIDFLVGMGIVRGLLGRLTPEQHAEAGDAIRDELAGRYEPAIGVRLEAGVWQVSARA